MGIIIFLIILFLLKLLIDGSLDFIYPIIIGILAIICPIMSCILLYDGGREILSSCAFIILITIIELIGIIFLSSKFILIHNAKRFRKTIGCIINVISGCCILLIITRLLMIIF